MFHTIVLIPCQVPKCNYSITELKQSRTHCLENVALWPPLISFVCPRRKGRRQQREVESSTFDYLHSQLRNNFMARLLSPLIESIIPYLTSFPLDYDFSSHITFTFNFPSKARGHFTAHFLISVSFHPLITRKNPEISSFSFLERKSHKPVCWEGRKALGKWAHIAPRGNEVWLKLIGLCLAIHALPGNNGTFYRHGSVKES